MEKKNLNKKLSKLVKEESKSKTSKVFGPTLTKSRPIQMKSNFTKVIHYDCGIINNEGDDDDIDIPDEDEIYIKENLLLSKKEEIPIDHIDHNEHDDDLSLVNINVSKLLSSSGSNSKNSMTNTSKEQSKISINSNGNKINSPSANIKGNNSISAKSKKGASSFNSNKYSGIKKPLITSKRKILYDKSKSITNNNNSISNNSNNVSNNANNAAINASNNAFNKVKSMSNSNMNNINNNSNNTNVDEELLDKVEEPDTNKSSNVRVTNITNIILNVKNISPKSFDIKGVYTPNNKDFMMRDMKSLHLITQRALTTATNERVNSVDSFDDERRSFMNFRNNSSAKKELYINDNSDLNIEKNNTNKRYNTNTKLSQIINIININNNYPQNNNYIATEPQNESFRLSKTKLNKFIPHASTGYKNTGKNNVPLKDFISSIKNSQKNKKEHFVAIGKAKK